MTEWKLRAPVAFVIFNRPETTARVFTEIANARPSKLLVVGDGPREGRAGEAEKVAATRAIIDRVDWECEVLTNFSEKNLGCRVRVSSGIDWIFQECEEAIIVEDDCLPHPTFFRFCDELLERYRDEERVAMISGDNFQLGRKWTRDSYYFSRYSHIWGWASWRRAWKRYDRDIRAWPEMRNADHLSKVIRDPEERRYWESAFQRLYEGRIDTWDYQWLLTLWRHGMVSVMPSVNLVSNIGHGPDATHTHDGDPNSALPTEPMSFPLRHPPVIATNRKADDRDAEEFTGRGRFARGGASESIVSLGWRKLRGALDF
jgi:hypothetical protein